LIELESVIYTKVSLKDDVFIKNGVVLFSGIVNGSIEIGDTSGVLLTGIVCGQIINKGQLLITGIVNGSIETRGGNLEIAGIINGDVINHGGKIKLHQTAKVKGTIQGAVDIIPGRDDMTVIY
jgi:hypothetical protein